MPDRSLSSTKPCEVVPGPGELPCTKPRGYKEHHRLCSTHHQEYIHLTTEYHATTEEATSLYRRVHAQGLDDLSVIENLSAADVEEAVVTVQDCIDIINKEIRERRYHHGRFFTELEKGHEEWIRKLRGKLIEVERIASRLCRRKAALASPKRRQPREQHIVAGARDRNTGSRLRTRYISPAARRPVCIAYLAKDSRHDRVRCTREGALSTRRCQEHQDENTEVLSALRAAENEYSDMGANIYDITDPNRSVSAQTLSQDIPRLTQYIALADTITALSGTLSRLGGYFKPPSSYRKADMAMDGLSRDVVASLHSKLESTRTELLRAKLVQVTKEPVPATSTQYRRETQDPYPAKAQAATPKCDSGNEGLGWGESTRSESVLRPKPVQDEGYGWGTVITAATVGTVVSVAVVGITTFLRFRRG